jgi:putative ATP-binding cassette transporter
MQPKKKLKLLELDKKVSENNSELSTTLFSQGQRKRLAMLSALLEDRPINIFDEWAAEQDVHYRKVYYRTVLPSLKAKGKALIVISHEDRCYSIADRVIKLDYGNGYSRPTKCQPSKPKLKPVFGFRIEET